MVYCSVLAVFLQIAVFLQPLLPKQYQIAPVCETISRALYSNQLNISVLMLKSIPHHHHEMQASA
jgi:hypothetical protein